MEIHSFLHTDIVCCCEETSLPECLHLSVQCILECLLWYPIENLEETFIFFHVQAWEHLIIKHKRSLGKGEQNGGLVSTVCFGYCRTFTTFEGTQQLIRSWMLSKHNILVLLDMAVPQKPNSPRYLLFLWRIGWQRWEIVLRSILACVAWGIQICQMHRGLFPFLAGRTISQFFSSFSGL